MLNLRNLYLCVFTFICAIKQPQVPSFESSTFSAVFPPPQGSRNVASSISCPRRLWNRKDSKRCPVLGGGGQKTLFLNGLTHRTGCSHIPHLVPRQLRSKLLIKCQLDPLDVVTELDGRSQLQVHTLLHCREVQQQQRLSVNFLIQENPRKRRTVSGPDEANHISNAPLQGAGIQTQFLRRLSFWRLWWRGAVLIIRERGGAGFPASACRPGSRRRGRGRCGGLRFPDWLLWIVLEIVLHLRARVFTQGVIFI